MGSIEIGHLVDIVHVISAAPLTFTFNTFSVVVEVIPTDVLAFGPGVFTGRVGREVYRDR